MRARPETISLHYTIGACRGRPSFTVTRDGALTGTAADAGDFLYLLDREILVQAQKLRPDLYFVHAAVVELGGKAFLLVAASGGGKSITTWALLHHGFRYLSDELAPFDLPQLSVHPYLRALCLKDEPPPPYRLPAATIYTSRTMHVPATELPLCHARRPVPVAALFFIHYEPERIVPLLERLSSATAATLLYANVLNALAHQTDGLDAALRIAAACPCFRVTAGDLPGSCTTLARAAGQLLAV
jgi:hypothetical protein